MVVKENNDTNRKKFALIDRMQSGLAALIGIQSSQKHQNDFEQNSPWSYITMGILLISGFIILILNIVQWVI